MKTRTSSFVTLSTAFSLFLLPVIPFTGSASGQVKPIAARKSENTSTKKSSPKTLARFAVNLTELARLGSISPAPVDDSAVERTLRILTKTNDNNPLLLDEMNGITSTTVVEHIAKRIAANEAPASLRNKQIWKLDLDRVFTGVDRTVALVRLNTLLSEVLDSDGQYILYLDQLTSIDNHGPEVVAVVRQALERNLQCMSVASMSSYQAALDNDQTLVRHFSSVKVDENATGDAEERSLGSDYEFVGDKVSPDLRAQLQSSRSTKRAKVILQADDVNNPELRSLLRRHGATINESMQRLGALEVELPLRALEQIAASDQTGHLSLDRDVNFLGHVEVTTGADEMRSQSGNSSFDGTGIGVAVLDSGLFRDHDSMDQIRFEMDFTGEGTKLDWFGHGTHVTGLLSNKDNFGGNFLGVAPKVDIINLRVLNKQGVGRTTSVLSALNWILEPTDPSRPSGEKNFQKYRIKIVNLSLGAPAIESYQNDPLCRAVRRLVDTGIVVVAASGNNGKDSNGQKAYGLIHSPGNEPSAITVGATNTFGTDSRADDEIASFSSRGPTRSYWSDSDGVKHYDNLIKPELVAPGNKLVAAEAAVKTRIDGVDRILPNLLIQQHPELRAVNDSDYKKRMMRLSGTSMATPIVAGAVALMLQANPRLTPNLIKMLLMYSAQPLAGHNTLEQGAGQLNIEGAIRLAKMVRTDLTWATTASGTSLLKSNTLPTTNTTIADHQFTWARGILLNHHYATGNNLVMKYQSVYGLGFVIGDGFVLGDGIMVGDGFAVGDGIMVGDNILTSDGFAMGDGTVFLSGDLLRGNGIMVADGFVIGDGIILSDGFVLGDGFVMGDAAVEAMSALINGDNTAAMR